MKDEPKQPEELQSRTKRFALSIIQQYVSLPKTDVTKILGRQFLRSGTSVGAHYREAGRARSDAEFISKLEVALQELDETIYWLELLVDSGQQASPSSKPLISEANELIAIIVTIVCKRKSAR